MTKDNYKRATFILESDNSIDLKIEGEGPMILSAHQYQVMSLALREMMDVEASLCWQDYVPMAGYIRVTKRKYLCNSKCTRHGIQAAQVAEPVKDKRIPLVDLSKLKISERLKTFDFFNNRPDQLQRKRI